MRITKLGHCCLIVEITTPASEDGGTPFVKGDKRVRIMTDPGTFTTAQNEQKNIDIILITHEHQDHLHVDSLKTVLRNNPTAKVITNCGVGAILEREGIPYELLEDKQSKTIAGVLLEGFGEKHGVIYQELGQVVNTGYFIAGRFFYPGDALYDPQKTVEILALPLVGPWLKSSEAVDYAKKLKPKIAFPVHDMLLTYTKPFLGPMEKFLPPAGIEFKVLELGKKYDF
ncbi:MAG: MBL fold metallo-hydrolase [Patescibacteria group bacterium]